MTGAMQQARVRTFLVATCFLVITAIFGGGSASAQQPPATEPPPPPVEEPDVTPDRPDFTNGTAIVPLGHVQVEAGVTATFSGSDRDVSVGETLVRIPLSQRFEVRFGVPSFLSSHSEEFGDEKGVDDLFVETKIRVASSRRAAIAVLVNASLPTGSRNVAERRLQPGATLAADLTLSDAVGLISNFGFSRSSSNGEYFNQVSVSGSFGFNLLSRTDGFAELYVLNKAEARGHAQRYTDAGFSFNVTRRTVLDVRVGTGLGNGGGGPDYFVGFGLTRLF